MSRHLRTKSPAPVLSTPHFTSVFNFKESRLLTDERGHIRAIEFIALTDTIFKVEERDRLGLSEFIFQASSCSYPKKELFIDVRFTEEVDPPEERVGKSCPDQAKITAHLESLVGAPYLWGGNWSFGIPALLKYYTPAAALSKELEDLWQLKGVDCSGLLYQATSGFTPRNSSDLLNFGTEVKFSRLEELRKIIRPLDILVYRGHVVIALDQETVIESREKAGVVKSPLLERVKEFPKNFSVRRWIN